MMETYNKQKTFKYDNIKCSIHFGRYHNGAHRMVLKDYMTGEQIASCTVNMAKDGVKVSAFNTEILIKTWGENEGLYEALRDNDIISKKQREIPVGFNYAYQCDLLINPIYYESI